ncbi:MAG: LysM peptidoglycan-binding domain-containing protein [Smithellaceae bacterium]
MNKFFVTVLIAMLCSLAGAIHSASAAEDTAQLTFSKTAIARKDLQIYTVQKGDMISAIIRKLPDVRERDIPNLYRTIKELNPDISDLNMLRTGQDLVLPGKVLADIPDPTRKILPAQTVAPERTAGQAYRVKSGDSLIKIVHRELAIRANTQSTLQAIKSLNPSITDVNRIYAGQMIRLPDVSGRTAAPVEKIEPVTVFMPTDEAPAIRNEIATRQEPFIMSPEARMAVIKHIITQLNGTMLTNGNYYLPVSATEQWTIDCAMIPVIELPTGVTILLDLENRAHRQLKKFLREKWKSHHLITLDNKDDLVMILKKIFQTDRSFEFARADKPVSAGTSPPAEIVVDWLITRKNPSVAHPLSQALRFVYEDAPLLPRAFINFARQNNLMITEISPQKGLVGRPQEIYSIDPLPVLSATTASDFAYALLSYLDYDAARDIDVQVFDIAKDGFNLSIKADLVVTHRDRPHLIFSRNLPPQFIGILQKAGNEIIFISDKDDPVKNMETLLRAFSFVFTTGYFSFSGLDVNQPPYHIGFGGTKIKMDKDLYVVHFDFDDQLRGLLQENWSAHIIRY